MATYNPDVVTSDIVSNTGSFFFSTKGYGLVTAHVKLTGVTGGNFKFEASVDSTNGTDGAWVDLYGARSNSGNVENTTGALSATQVYTWDFPVLNYQWMRVTATAGTFGTASWTLIRAIDSPEPIPSVQQSGTWSMQQSGTWTVQPGNTANSTAWLVTDSKLPTAAASADSLANPTITQVGADNMLFNGTTWDRQRANFATNTGDTGAKIASFAGATQTNYNARGATIVVNMGTVSGTTPTCAAKIQGSADGGTTWYDIPNAVTANITASGVTALAVYPGAQTVANASVSAPLPRTWRVYYTIGGTSPSFTITNVQVAYVL